MCYISWPFLMLSLVRINRNAEIGKEKKKQKNEKKRSDFSALENITLNRVPMWSMFMSLFTLCYPHYARNEKLDARTVMDEPRKRHFGLIKIYGVQTCSITG